jgi:hypothetical protein
MAISTSVSGQQQDPNAAMNQNMRQILNDAYAFVRGNDYSKSVANLTYEELLDAAIDRIEGTSTDTGNVRSTKLQRIAKIKNDLVSAVDTIKAKPASAWVANNADAVEPDDSVNTPEEG